MLETWNLVRKYIHICFRNYTFRTKYFPILLMSAFFSRISIFLAIVVSCEYCKSCARDFLVLLLVFVRWKVTINENVSFIDYTSGIPLPDCSNSAINWKNDNDVTIYWNGAIVNIFWPCFVSLVKYSYWAKFHFNIISGSRVMTIYFCKRPEIGKSDIFAKYLKTRVS